MSTTFNEQMNYQEFEPVITRGNSCTFLKTIFVAFGMTFAGLMLYLMILMVQILQNMNTLMKSTTSNTYGMCELTKALAMDNTTTCMHG